MQTKDLTAVFMIFALAASFATATQANDCGDACSGSNTPSDPGGDDPDPKGNNGWGNGIDGTNPGSNAGPPSQVETKNNREIWDKFDGKFQGR